MASYHTGQCIPLNNDGDVIFCEVLGYIGNGQYHVSLTRGLVEVSAKRFLSVSTIHESTITELALVVD